MKWNCLMAALLIIPLVALGCAPAASAPTPAAPSTTSAAFTTSNLTVTPDSVKPGETAMVGVTVTNTGGEQGTYTVMVKLHDGTIVGMQDVTLAGGSSKNVPISISLNSAGTHMIMVDDLSRNLVVQASAAMTPATTTPTPGTGPAAFTDGAFTISDLTIIPKLAMPTDKVEIAVMVKNNGGPSGTYKLVLKIQDNKTRMEDTKTQDVTLAGGASKKVAFAISAGEDGTYTIKIGELTGTLTVDEHAGM